MIASKATIKLICLIQKFLGRKTSRKEEQSLDAYSKCFDQQIDDFEILDPLEKETLAREMKTVILQRTDPVDKGQHIKSEDNT